MLSQKRINATAATSITLNQTNSGNMIKLSSLPNQDNSFSISQKAFNQIYSTNNNHADSKYKQLDLTYNLSRGGTRKGMTTELVAKLFRENSSQRKRGQQHQFYSNQQQMYNSSHTRVLSQNQSLNDKDLSQKSALHIKRDLAQSTS